MPVMRLLNTLTNRTLAQRAIPTQRGFLPTPVSQAIKPQLKRHTVKNGCRDYGYIHPDAFELISNLVGCIEA